MIKIWIPGIPVGKGRPRMTRAGHCFTPQKTRIYEDKVALFGAEAMKGAGPLEGAVGVYIEAVFPIPESWPKKKKEQALSGVIFPGKPDIDNIMKTVDGLNGIAWKDDAQIIQATVRKRYGSIPALNITVVSIDVLLPLC